MINLDFLEAEIDFHTFSNYTRTQTHSFLLSIQLEIELL